jgi:hypothetical protein
MKTYNKWMNEWGKRVSDLEKANNVPSVVATGATVAATTTVAITSAGSSTSTAAPTASGVTVMLFIKKLFLSR